MHNGLINNSEFLKGLSLICFLQKRQVGTWDRWQSAYRINVDCMTVPFDVENFLSILQIVVCSGSSVSDFPSEYRQKLCTGTWHSQYTQRGHIDVSTLSVDESKVTIIKNKYCISYYISYYNIVYCIAYTHLIYELNILADFSLKYASRLSLPNLKNWYL